MNRRAAVLVAEEEDGSLIGAWNREGAAILAEAIVANPVSVDGDIDGPGLPYVTLLGGTSTVLRISSGGNQLRALALRGFQVGVTIEPSGDGTAATGRTFEGHTISRLTIRAAHAGIVTVGPLAAGRALLVPG